MVNKDKILIIESDYYKEISKNLFSGAKKILDSNNLGFEKITVPGALEIPVILNKNKKNFIGFLTLGCVIRGQTSHYDIVCNVTSDSIFQIVNDNCLAHGFGIITTENYDQALERSNVIGSRAMEVCLKMIENLSSYNFFTTNNI